MTSESKQGWDNATWEGNRKAQLRAPLKLSAKERFEALEELAETSDWLTNAVKNHHDLTAPVQKQAPSRPPRTPFRNNKPITPPKQIKQIGPTNAAVKTNRS